MDILRKIALIIILPILFCLFMLIIALNIARQSSTLFANDEEFVKMIKENCSGLTVSYEGENRVECIYK